MTITPISISIPLDRIFGVSPGVVLFQQQNAIHAGAQREPDGDALRALVALAATDGVNYSQGTPKADRFQKQHFHDLSDSIYQAAISSEQGRIAGVIREMQHAGIGDQDIASAFVPTVARRLGTAWEQDSLPFSTVTIGSARLQSVVRRLEIPDYSDRRDARLGRRNCLVVVPKGAQHTLGAIVLTSQLRQAEVRVKLMLGVSDGMMLQLVDAASYDAVMISGADPSDLESLSALVKSSRTKTADTKVLLGGCMLGQSVDLVKAIDIDLVSNNWQEALDLCVRDDCHGH